MRPPASNVEIVAKALREKRADFAGFVRRRAKPEEVEDILQNAAVKAIERADLLSDPERVVAWLYRLHRNLIIDSLRKGTVEKRVIDQSSHLPEQATPEVEEHCHCSISQAQTMGGNYASILSLVDIAGLDLTEAAGVLEISKNNATVRLHRARRALSEKMQKHCGVESLRDCLDCRCVYDGCCAV